MLLISLAISVILAALAPATAPAPGVTSPAAPAKPRSDEVVVADARNKFHFAVPKIWKAVEQPPGERSLYVFQLPAAGEARKATPSWIITAEPPANADDTLETVRDRMRERISHMNAGTTFDTDEAATHAGQPGWTFSYTTTLTVTVLNGKGERSHDEKVKVRVLDHMMLANGLVFEFVLTTDERGLPIRSKQVARAISTLAFDAK